MDKKYMDTLLSLEHIIFDLREDNINSSAEEIMKLFDCEYPFSFYFIICNISFYFYCSHKYEPDNLIHFLSEIKKLSNSDEDILQIFVDTLINFFPKSGANYILQKMIDEKIISSDVVENINFLYFIHCDPKIVKIFNKDPLNYYLYKDKIFNNICKTLQKNYEELSKNDWKLHKQLIEEGVNPNEIAKIIRNDEIEKLQEISSQTNFDFNQTIEPSLYERCSFINQKDVTLIEYAAFFGSVKCFKYLLMNGANVNDTAKYSIAGGNEEIIHLCEQNHSTFEGVYETAIQFHKNDIFKYVYENKLEEINNLEEIEKKCITYYNFEILSFLINEGKKVNNSIMKISDSIIKTSANSGNLYLVKYFLQLDPIPKDILPYSANSMNHELVKLFIEKGNDVNVKNDRGETALIVASKNGFIRIVKLLLEQEGIDVNAQDYWLCSSLMHAVENNQIEVVKILLEQDLINVNAYDCDSTTILMMACKKGNIEIVKLLLARKDIQIFDTNDYVKSALTAASSGGDIEIVKLLLEKKGIEECWKGRYYGMAIISASGSGNIEIVKLLLQQEGVDINFQGPGGRTALMYACQTEHIEIVKLLLEQEGIDVNIKDKTEFNALIIAYELNNQELIDIFTKHGGKVK